MTIQSILTRQNRNTDASPVPSSFSTPGRPRFSRGMSPPLSYQSGSTFSTPTVIGRNPKPTNIVTRVAIEGRAKQNEDKVSINMFLKLSVPLDSDVTSGSSIPLFPEESVQLGSFQVHPLDSNSVPYNFSSTTSPLLRRAARALNLPTRSQETFYSACNIPSPPGNTTLISPSTATLDNRSSDSIPPVEDKYTGRISISQYHVSYILPKIFPLRQNETKASMKNRRTSIGEKNIAHFMVAIELKIPYLTKPSKNPYLVSIPTPRCLHNQIKLNIFPNSTATSFASLSSQEGEAVSWDLATDPQVTRSSTSRSRSSSFNHFADDESSDASLNNNSPDGPAICGTFPSAERIRIRWAKPPSPINRITAETNDGMARANVNKVNGTMTCTVKGKMVDPVTNIEGIAIRLEYKAECTDISFPGVATLVGLDAYLEAKGSDVSWITNSEPDTWEVSGGVGFVGFNCGPTLRNGLSASRHSSLDSNASSINFGLATSSKIDGSKGDPLSRQSSNSSLLRAPLPNQNVPDYSFEGSHSALGAMPSSITSSSFASDVTRSLQPPPQQNLTLHVNINDILPPSPNIFVFTIAGTVLVTPQASLRRLNAKGRRHSVNGYGSESDTAGDELEHSDPITLPHFTLLSSQHETTTFVLRNEAEPTVQIEILEDHASPRRDGEPDKMKILRRGPHVYRTTDTSCRILAHSTGGFLSNGGGLSRKPSHPNPSRPRLPGGTPSSAGKSSIEVPSRGASPRPPLGRNMMMTDSLRPKRDGPLMIPSVDAVIIPLRRGAGSSSQRRSATADVPEAYSVRLTMPAPSDIESEWLEFGLAQSANGGILPKVQVASASLEGVPVKFETHALRKDASSKVEGSSVGPRGDKILFGEMSGRDWESWVRVRVGGMGGGTVIVDYVVQVEDCEDPTGKGKRKTKDPPKLDIFLPTFSIPVGRLSVEVQIMEQSGLEISSMETNLRHQQLSSAGPKLLQYSLEPFFCPAMSLCISKNRMDSPSKSLGTLKLFLYLGWFITSLGFIFMFIHTSNVGSEVRFIHQQIQEYVFSESNRPLLDENPQPLLSSTSSEVPHSSHWWFGDSGQEYPAHSSSSESETSPGGSGHQGQTFPDDEFTHTSETTSTPPLETATLMIYPTHSSSHTLSAVVESYALLPLHHLLAAIPAIVNVDGLQYNVQRMMRTTWWALWKLYHYPLDPP